MLGVKSSYFCQEKLVIGGKQLWPDSKWEVMKKKKNWNVLQIEELAKSYVYKTH